jgi:hypothetical protein
MKEKQLKGILATTDSNEWTYRRCCFEYIEGLTFYWVFGVKLPVSHQIKDNSPIMKPHKIVKINPDSLVSKARNFEAERPERLRGLKNP